MVARVRREPRISYPVFCFKIQNNFGMRIYGTSVLALDSSSMSGESRLADLIRILNFAGTLMVI